MFVYLLLLVAVAAAKSYPPRVYDLELAEAYFKDFKTTYDRQYESAEEHDARLEIFKQNLHKINIRNMEIGPNFGITKFSDMTPEEFSAQYTGFDGSSSSIPYTKFVSNRVGAPEAYDWREQGKVSPVKNQEQCGSCWAFSATGMLESRYLMKNNQQITLSEQQLVDCDTGSSGCSGGFSEKALGYAQNAGGLESDSAYPYEAQNGVCQFNPDQVALRVSNIQQLQLSSDEEIKQALMQYGPLSIALDSQLFKEYVGGVLNCPPGMASIDHAVLLIGYGADHWIIKNSWGDWGEEGFIRIAMNDNPCGMKSEGFLTADVD